MKNILENNKLMAKFLGAKQYDETDDFIYFDETNNIFSNDTISLKNLKFNTDWNWLMEVVEKIENWEGEQFYIIHSMSFNKRSISIKTESNRVFKNIEIFYNKGEKIQATYKACAEFIKWYNEQKN